MSRCDKASAPSVVEALEHPSMPHASINLAVEGAVLNTLFSATNRSGMMRKAFAFGLLTAIVAGSSACTSEAGEHELGASSSALHEGQTFAVLTYNVQSRPVLDSATSTHRNDSISRLLNNYDIAAVQESFVKTDILFAHAGHQTKTVFNDRRHFWSLTGSGLATLAKFPLGAMQTQHYHAVAGIADSVASKGILLTRLLIDGMHVDLYDTHMQAGASEKENSARFDQADELIAFVNQHSSTKDSVLIVGDFNMGPARPGKPYEAFSPNHYANEWDMKFRTGVFQRVIDTLGMQFLSDVMRPDRPDYIEGILFRAGCGNELTPVSYATHEHVFRDEQGASLSDSTPVVGTFKIRDLQSVACSAEPLIATRPRPNTVRLYADCGYQGRFVEMTAGHSFDFGASPFNDVISSIQTGPNASVRFYENSDKTGANVNIAGNDVWCLLNEGMNDKISFVEVSAAP